MSTGLNKKNKWSIKVNVVSKTGYEWKQTMRRLETEARKSREQITLAKAAGNKDLEKKYRKRLRAINTKYNSIADATGIKAQPEKMRVYGKTVGKLDDKNIIAKSTESDIKKTVSESKAVNDVHSVGRINRDIYSCVTEDIVTDEVIITDERIQHIKERHPNDFERYNEYIRLAVENPEYIIEANKEKSALILKSFSEGSEQFKMVLRLITSTDNPEYKNSIITFMKIDEKEWKRLINNKKILYKLE